MKNHPLERPVLHNKLTVISLTILILIACSYNSSAQLQSKNVNIMQLMVKDGLEMSRVDNIVCDKQNIIWIKTNRGLQYWDGQNFYNYKDSTLEVGANFHLHAHPEEGIYISTPGKLKQLKYEKLEEITIYKSKLSDFSPIPILNQERISFMVHPDTICVIDSKGNFVKSKVSIQTNPNLKGVGKYLINGNYYIIDIATQKHYSDRNGLFSKTMASMVLPHIRNTIISNTNEVIISQKTGINILKAAGGIIYQYPDNQEATYYSAVLQINDDMLLVGVDHLLFEFDLKEKKWKTIYKNFDQKDLLQTGYFDKLIFDNHKNIWAITVNEGLLKIYNNEYFDYYGTNIKNVNFVKNLIADEEENRILNSALDGGILVYDTLGNLRHHFTSKNTNAYVNSVTGIYKIGKDQYIYNNHNDSLIYTLTFNGDTPKFDSKLTKIDSYLYYQDAVKNDKNSSFLLFNTLYELIHVPLKLNPIFHFQSSKSCIIKDGKTLWIGCIDGILRHEIGDADNYQFINLPKEGYVRSISKYEDNKLAIGSDKGLSIYTIENGELNTVFEGCIYCLLMDEKKNIWTGTGEGIFRFDENFDKTQYSIIDGLQNSEFNTNSCEKGISGKMYFGGINGITAFDPKKIPNKNDHPTVFIKALNFKNINAVTNVKVGKIDEYNLKYDQNNISFAIGAIGKYESALYNYQYFVEGLSDGWVNAEQQVKYNFNLSPGKYKFYFTASNSFDSNAPLTNPLIVNIGLPWWKEWWFYLILFVLVISSITYIIRNKEKQKYLKKKYDWNLEYQRQEDRMKMSKELHDNIGSRLTFLVSSIENIKKLFQTNSDQAIKKIDYLTDFGKDTIEDLRSMMWVLTQKTISVQDLQLKILDYLNIAKNTYRNIDFRYEGPQVGLEKELNSKLSQNIFRVVQEAIHNCVKHAKPTIVSIRLTIDNQYLNISIEDNGIGFDTQNSKSGHGLQNMKSRLREHSSELIISSKLDKGTTINFTVEISH